MSVHTQQRNKYNNQNTISQESKKDVGANEVVVKEHTVITWTNVFTLHLFF